MPVGVMRVRIMPMGIMTVSVRVVTVGVAHPGFPFANQFAGTAATCAASEPSALANFFFASSTHFW